MIEPIQIFWFRRDLRLEDNAALYHALKSGLKVLPIFIFDQNILEQLDDKADARVHFIHEQLNQIHQKLIQLKSGLKVYYGKPLDVFKTLIKTYNIHTVFCNRDYELYAVQRDTLVADFLNAQSIGFKHYKDQVIFEKEEVMKDDGTPYTVFTPYSKKWKAKLNGFYASSYPTEKYFNQFYSVEPENILSLNEIGFRSSNQQFPISEVQDELLKKYQTKRDYPSAQGTSKLGVHLRFGTISIRKLLQKSLPLSETFVNELIWRDFYHMIIHHFPHVQQGLSFKKEYDLIEWRNNEQEFELWCAGKTGYPIVDAGMRELNATGYMHNRVRMIVASFLTKHLLIDWRWGEAYFAKKLLDYDFAANNGGWQWAAGSGCDAAPYFRVFNPTLQTQKFDQHYTYIKQWVSEFNTSTYPKPIVEHDFARKRCLAVYAKALKPN